MAEFLRDRTARGLNIKEVNFEGNTCGFAAVDYKVFVRKDEVEEKTAGGIVIAADARDQEKWNVSTGIVVSHGDLAFTDGRKADGSLIHWAKKPQVGDRVMIKEYAGVTFQGADGNEYFVYNDKDIMGVAV